MRAFRLSSIAQGTVPAERRTAFRNHADALLKSPSNRNSGGRSGTLRFEAAAHPAADIFSMNPLILIVDDDDDLRSVMQRTLALHGYRVTTARDGDEALAACRTALPDLVLMDLVMPGKEGIETILELKRRHPEATIIAMSGGGRRGSTAFLEMARRLGAVQALAKPFSNDELLFAIQSALERGTKDR